MDFAFSIYESKVITYVCHLSFPKQKQISLFTPKPSKEIYSTKNVPTPADNYFTVLHLPRWTSQIGQLQAHGILRAAHMESMCQPASAGRVNGHVYRTPQTSGTTKSLQRASRVSFVQGFHRASSCMCTHLTAPSNTQTPLWYAGHLIGDHLIWCLCVCVEKKKMWLKAQTLKQHLHPKERH